MSCDREAEVHAYHDRQLPPAAREAFEQHLAECPSCAELLRQLRGVTGLILSAPMPQIPANVNARYYAAWNASSQRGILRIASWLTAAAAAALVGSLLLLPGTPPNSNQIATSNVPTTWEAVALMPPPPPDRISDRPDDLVELAQWMADDLSTTGAAELR